MKEVLVATQINIRDLKEKVIMDLEYEDGLRHVSMTPEHARICGEALARSAHQAATGQPAGLEGSLLSEQVRQRCFNRAHLMFLSMEKKGYPKMKIISEIVDAVLGEAS